MGEIIFLVIDGSPLHLEASESLGMQCQQHPVILVAINTHHGLKKIPKEAIIPPLENHGTLHGEEHVLI